MASTKFKTFKLLEILYQETDTLHRLKTNELIEKLAEQGIKCDRRSIYDDIELFRKLGIDVKKDVGYYIGERSLTLEEVKIITDAISAADFLTVDIATKIKDKLVKQLSRTDAQIISEQFYTDDNKDKVYKNSSDVLNIICGLVHAIHNRRSICIKTNNGRRHDVCPYSLLMNNQKYYLVCYNIHDEKVYHYRIDRIAEIKSSRFGFVSANKVSDYENSVDTAKYKIHTYNMYSGELTEVSICFHADIYEYMKNHFEDAEFKSAGNGMFKCKINVNVSDGFYRFVFGYGSQIQVLEPKEVADEVKRRALEIAEMYK